MGNVDDDVIRKVDPFVTPFPAPDRTEALERKDVENKAGAQLNCKVTVERRMADEPQEGLSLQDNQ